MPLDKNTVWTTKKVTMADNGHYVKHLFIPQIPRLYPVKHTLMHRFCGLFSEARKTAQNLFWTALVEAEKAAYKAKTKQERATFTLRKLKAKESRSTN